MRDLRREDGFTMAELLVVLVISGVVLAGVSMLMQVVMRQTTGNIARAEVTQRGRLVVDDITRTLRSQVCIDTATGSEQLGVAAATSNSVTVFTDLSDGSKQPLKRQITFDPSTKKITQTTWTATSAFGTTPTTWSAAGSTKTLIDNVTAPGTGMFAYWAYAATGTPRPINRPLAAPSSGMSATDLADVAQIDVSVDVRPTRNKDPNMLTHLDESVHLRTADPNQNNPDPDCR
jgi:prepilin-type N-terminal cleavage/methylation domain-containing protein